MRLLDDIITGEHRVLSEREQSSYHRAVRQLEAVNWTLDYPQQLEQISEIYSVTEVPRIAYSLQMRSDVEHFHYYTVLSKDPVLDQVNRLFGHYMLDSNSRNIASGGFWQPVGNRCTGCHDSLNRADAAKIIFAAGAESSDEDRNSMARLIFSTSYLEYCSVDNPQQMDIVSLQRAQNIDPWISHITVIFKPNGDFAGFFTAGLMEALKQTPATYLYREEMISLDRDYDFFIEKNSQDRDYFIASLALEAIERGKGYFRVIMEEVERQANQHNASRMTLCVWESSVAFSLYKKWGFCQIDSSDRWRSLFADRLCFLAKEICG